MNRKQKKRTIILITLITLLGTAASLVLYALKQNINLFYTPTQLLAAHVQQDQNLRIGGYVKKKSVEYDFSGQSVHFIITDRSNEIAVNYHGVLPNLFREGQAVVVTGKLTAPTLVLANEVLAKHDEKYMPKPLKDLKKGEGYGA